MPGAHRKKNPGRHRRPASLSLTWRTTGGVIAGAAILGTAAATAQASVLPFGPGSASTASADLSPGQKKTHAKPSAHGGGPAKRSKAGDGDGPREDGPGKDGPGKDGPGKDGPGEGRPGEGRPGGGAPEEPSEASRPTAEQAIEIARSQVGVKEDGGGETKFQKWYMGTARAQQTLDRDGGSLGGYSDANWCDMFVSWVGEQIGFTDQIGSDAWTVAHARWFQQNGRWGAEPKPGAIVFYAWDGGKSSSDIRHVGMVIEKVDDGTIRTVEGNTGNAVQVKERSTGDVVGYGYPDYRS